MTNPRDAPTPGELGAGLCAPSFQQRRITMITSTRISLQHIVSLVLLSVVLAGCAADPKVPSPELQQRIEAARTRADHEALSTYYEREAAGARAIATEHRKMAKTYQGMALSGRGGGSMTAHCNSIVRMYEGIAAEYDGLATDHRQMAERAQP
jgi:outer membrane murein-binding lipoprotein Lpp